MSQFRVIAFRNLVSHKGRTLVLGGAIAAVTMMVVVMLALTSGIRTRMIENATALSTGHVNVAGWLKISQTSAAPLVTKAAEMKALIQKTVPEATLVVDRVRAFGKLISDEASIMAPMSGVDMKTEEPLLGGLPTAEGKIMDLAKPGHIVIFESHAKKLKVKVGDTLTISMPTYRNVYNTKDVQVAAILKNLGMISSFTIFINAADAREIYDMAADSTGVFQVYLPDIAKAPEVENRLRQAFSDAKYSVMDKDSNPFWMKFERVAGESWSGQKIDITDWQDETSFLKWVIDLFNALTVALTLTLMCIVTVGLVNNMWMAIRERTSEIGTMRAVGLQRRGVLWMFFLESSMLAVMAVGTGIAAGCLVAGLLNLIDIQVSSEAFVMFLMSNSLWLNVRLVDLTIVFVGLSVLLVVGGFIPAYRASKMKPITAINHVS